MGLALSTAVVAQELDLSFLQGGSRLDNQAWQQLNSKYAPGQYLVDVSLNNTNSGVIPTVARGVLIENLSDYREVYTNKGTQTHIWKNSNYDVSRVLTGVDEVDAFDITAGYSSHLSDIKTHWKNIPQTWTSQIIIHVQVA